jgi:hypothetical protein
LEAAARAIIDLNTFTTLATVDEQGLPWASGVVRDRRSARVLLGPSPQARHSRNLAVRPELAVIFDSQQQPSAVQAVYIKQLAEPDLARGIEIFSEGLSRPRSGTVESSRTSNRPHDIGCITQAPPNTSCSRRPTSDCGSRWHSDEASHRCRDRSMPELRPFKRLTRQ